MQKNKYIVFLRWLFINDSIGSDIMKKNPFLQGAMIATIGIIITKILGIIYVIPFYAIIGVQGGALYGYAYSIYSIFLKLSSIGIPLAMSKLISEYNTLEYFDIKERAFLIGKKFVLLLSVISFFILIFFAPLLAHIFIGDIQGGNTIEDVTFVIRVVASAILIVPILSVTRGYLQGHRFITPSSISQVLEQIVRVIIIVVGSYLCMVVFDLSLKFTIGLAVFGATLGAFISYLYLIIKMGKNKNELNRENESSKILHKISEKDILIKLLSYSAPFIFSSLILSFYHFVDLSTIVKTMVRGLNYDIVEAETTISILLVWGLKLNMIIMAIATGLTTSLLPNIISSYVADNLTDLRYKINRSIQILLFVTLPMAVGLSLLAGPVWTLFYGYNQLGTLVFKYSIMISIFTSLLIILNIILQSLNQFKKMFTFILTGFVIKLLFNIPLMYSFSSIGFHASYGVITASIIGYFISIGLILRFLKKSIGVNYEDTFNKIINIFFTVVIMSVVILLIQFVVPVDTANRLHALGLIIFYSIIGASIYIYITIKNKLLFEIVGKSFIERILTKMKINNFINYDL